MSTSLFAPSLDLSIQLAKSYKIDPLPILRDVGIDPVLITDYNARIPLAKVHQFYKKISDLIPNPNVGLRAGQYWHPTQMGALGYAWMTSSTLRSAFERLARFARIVLGSVNISIQEDEKNLSLIFDFQNEPLISPLRLNGSRSILLAMLRCNAGKDFTPAAVNFSYPEPKELKPFNDLFQCPVKFNCETDGISISLADADMPRDCSNKQLTQLNDQLLIEFAAQLDKKNIIERVKLAIIHELGTGYFSDYTVAAALHMSQRTLQRRLKENKTTFKTLVNNVRQELADKYLHDSNLSLTEISFMLGFSEMSAFSRAFKRWSGHSPSDYRDVH